MNVIAMRKSFVEKVSWGPGKITFGEAIAAFDHTLAEFGLDQKPAPSSYSPAPDAISVPVVAPRTTKKPKHDDDGMVLDSDQENAEALANLKVK